MTVAQVPWWWRTTCDPSGPSLVASFAEGVREQGCDVILIGLASTDGLYFASGRLDLPGAMFTASHNPAQYNGIKLCRPGAAPVGQDTGLRDIRRMIDEGVPAFDGPLGTVSEQDMLADYATFLRELVDVSGIRPLRIVVDAGNGMGGFTVPAVLGTAGGAARPCRSTSTRCTSSSTARSRTTRRTRSTRRTCATCRRGSARRRPTSAWPSTATPIGASSSTSAASWSTPRP